MQRPIEEPETTRYTHKTLLNSVRKILIEMYGRDNKNQINKILRLYHAQVQDTMSTMSVYHSSLSNERDAQCYCLAVQLYIGLVLDQDDIATFKDAKVTPSSLLSQCQQTEIIASTKLPSDKIKPSLDELAWWIERGILQTRRYTGLCTRMVYV